jgi:phosphoglycolate phosphatase
MRQFDLVMFDLDGTLVETAPEIMDAVNDTLALFRSAAGHATAGQRLDWPRHACHCWSKRWRSPPGGHWMRFAPVNCCAPWLPEYNVFYGRRCGTRSHLYPQVRETLEALRAQGSKLAVVTNKEGRYTQIVMAVQKLTDLFDVVISGDTLATKKPDPAGVAHCLALFGVTAGRALFVGDSSIDAATARAAGVAVWLLPYGYNMGQPIAACQPDRLIRNCSELLDL